MRCSTVDRAKGGCVSHKQSLCLCVTGEHADSRGAGACQRLEQHFWAYRVRHSSHKRTSLYRSARDTRTSGLNDQGEKRLRQPSDSSRNAAPRWIEMSNQRTLTSIDPDNDEYNEQLLPALPPLDGSKTGVHEPRRPRRLPLVGGNQ